MADFRTFDPCNLLAPVPAVMVSCRAPEADAKPNIVTVAWVGTVNSEPPMMSISVRGNRFSHDLIAKSGEFVVNLVDEAHCKALDFCGVRSGRDVDKWHECHLTPMKALNMEYAPAIAECPAYLACKVVQQLELGSHTLHFVMAPMVHWPEVMVCYESGEKVLFSADAFGKFGALDTDQPWTDEARRYYLNIVGKYGAPVQTLLKKAAKLDIRTICPLHGPVLTGDLAPYLEKYQTWSSYAPEEKGVLVAYASIHGNTAQAAALLAERNRGAAGSVPVRHGRGCGTGVPVRPDSTGGGKL